jgi:aerobic carbon-monoxide dehydrogenase medium subunit
MSEPVWHRPGTLAEALELRAGLGEDALPIAGGTYIGVLLAAGLIDPPAAFIALGGIEELRAGGLDGGRLVLGALVTHRGVERDDALRASGFGALAETFGSVANVRIRTLATVGGVLADADYASDPPAMLCALAAQVVLASPRGERRLAIEELILGHYETAIEADELLVRVEVPRPERAVYLKFRSRGSEDRPCVGVAAGLSASGELRVVVGAVAETPQILPAVCALAAGRELTADLREEIAARYGEGIEALGDLRGSAGYRRRVTRVLVRRALEAVA